MIVVGWKNPMSLPYASLAPLSVEDMKVDYCTLSPNVCVMIKCSAPLCCVVACGADKKGLTETSLGLALEAVQPCHGSAAPVQRRWA